MVLQIKLSISGAEITYLQIIQFQVQRSHIMFHEMVLTPLQFVFDDAY